jgi:hypothetical protein
MAAANFAIDTAPRALVRTGRRREVRNDTVRILEFSRYPRDAAEQQLRIGFTRDLSHTGMCVGVDQGERVGAILKVCVHDVDGGRTEPSIARVVWTKAESDGRFWLGLELLSGVCDQKIAA